MVLNRHSPLPALLVLLWLALGDIRAATPATPATPATETTPLFNGHSLAGWKTWLVDTRDADPRGVFSVTNGLLRISGDGLGYLGTTSEHHHYRLTVQWRWGTRNTHWGDRIGKARDSGLFLHATGPDGNSHDGHGAFMAAIECNIFQGAVGDFLLIRGTNATGALIAPSVTVTADAERDHEGWLRWSPHGSPQTIHTWGRVNHLGKDPAWRDVLDFRSANDPEHAAGEWNTLVCEAFEDRLRILVNGRVVNEASNVSPRRGRILLQCEGSEIFFRRVELSPLTHWPTAPPDVPHVEVK
ncbi:MAG: DUF1080 domain-containing protein [Verrucomicrobiales bacterium]|nr:DUF1080 domain-containing protein [Verrucomicrobiales bacterium]